MSDGSSDVLSADLVSLAAEQQPLELVAGEQFLAAQRGFLQQQQSGAGAQVAALEPGCTFGGCEFEPVLNVSGRQLQGIVGHLVHCLVMRADRKNVEKGTRGSVRVDTGGSSIIKKKNRT